MTARCQLLPRLLALSTLVAVALSSGLSQSPPPPPTGLHTPVDAPPIRMTADFEELGQLADEMQTKSREAKENKNGGAAAAAADSPAAKKELEQKLERFEQLKQKVKQQVGA